MAMPLDHPLPQRIGHWINLINFLVLGITGYLIHAPYPGVPMNFVRNLHFIFAYFLIINGIVRFYYSFFGKYKDYRAFFLDSLDYQTFWPMIKYYLFLGKRPQTNKYNPLQKLAFIAMPIMAFMQIITGAILYWPVKLASLAGYFGGIAAVRGIHYVIMWLFFALVVIHVYLAFTEAFDEFLVMFFGKTDKKGM